jgi:outer membrane protein
MKKTFLALALGLSFGALQAQEAGSWLIQGGLTRIAPNVSSGNLSAPSPSGTQVDVKSDIEPTAQVTYMLDDHWAVAVPLGLGFKHKIVGAGGIAGTGEIGKVKALPVGAFMQYRLGEANDRFRPYGMLGLNYAIFYGAQGSAALSGMNPINPPGGSTGLKVDSRWGVSPGLGLTSQLDNGWFIDVSWALTLLKTQASLSTGQTIDTRLNPSVLNLSLGKRF